MRAVSPPAPKKEITCNVPPSWLMKLSDAWFSLQVAHFGGKYSIERMLALEEYTRTASLSRVLFVSISLPLLIAGLVLCQESIPLQHPAAGWQQNYGFWLRVGFIGTAIGNACASQVGSWLDIADLMSTRQRFLYAISIGVGYIAVGMAAATWVFPVPFFMLSLSMATTMIIVGFLRVVVGAQAFGKIVSRPEQLQRLNRIAMLQGFMGVGYPAYQVLFEKTIHTPYEVPVVLLLLFFRLVMKIVFAHSAAYKEDLVPSQVVFTVDFFDALYLATFMPSLSPTTLAMVIVVDLCQTAFELHELNQRTRSILARLHQGVGVNVDGADGFFGAVRSLCINFESLQVRLESNIRVHSCKPHPLSPDGASLLENIAKLSSEASFSSSFRKFSHEKSPVAMIPRRVSPRCCIKRSSSIGVAVYPSASVDLSMKTTSLNVKRRSLITGKSDLLLEALGVLFTTECLVLTEFVEITIPALYGALVLGMAHLSSSQYHTEMVGITIANVGGVVSRMFLFALLEFASFIVLAVVLKRNCSIRVLYQLAFVLETEKAFVLSTVMLWMLMTLTFRVEHFGTFYFVKYEVACSWVGTLPIFWN